MPSKIKMVATVVATAGAFAGSSHLTGVAS